MELFYSRKLKFKAWNTETKLMMRLHSIDCVKGELIKKDYVLLQFTGLLDKMGEEVYDMDVLLKDNNKYIIHWNADLNAWNIIQPNGNDQIQFGLKSFVSETIRLRSYFESGN